MNPKNIRTLYQVAMWASLGALGLSQTACIGTADVAGLAETTGADAASSAGAGLDGVNGADALASLLPLLTARADDGGGDDGVSRREVAARVVDLAATASGASAKEWIVWGLASTAIRQGPKGLKASMLELLFSPLADAFVTGPGEPTSE